MRYDVGEPFCTAPEEDPTVRFWTEQVLRIQGARQKSGVTPNGHSAPVGHEPRGWVREETEMNFYKTNTGEFLAIETKLHSSGGVTGIAWGGDTEWLEHKYSGRDGTEQAVADYFEGQS